MIDFRSANVTHPILSVFGMSKRGVEAILGHKYGYLQKKGSKRLNLTCRGDLYFLRAKMENDDVHDCAPVMRDGDEDGDVEEAPENAGVDDDEREDAMATEMRGPDEPTNATRKHHQLTHIPFQARERAPDHPPHRRLGGRNARRDGHSNRLLLDENEATR